MDGSGLWSLHLASWSAVSLPATLE